MCYHGQTSNLMFFSLSANDPMDAMRSVVKRAFCPRPKPIHIKPQGHERVICDSPNRQRALLPQFVTGLMGATCKRCRERYQT